MSDLTKQLAEEFSDKEYAHAYMEEFNNMSIAAQIKALREQRGMTQQELAQRSGMKQERISALENVDYDAWTIKTLQKLARAFDVTVKMSFQAFSEGIMDVVNMNKERLEILAREEDLKILQDKKVIMGKDGLWKSVDTSHLTPIESYSVQRNAEPDSPFPDLDGSSTLTLDEMQQTRMREGLKDVSLEEWQASLHKKLNEPVNLNLTLEPDIAAWFKQQAEAGELNGLINSLLREAIHCTELEGKANWSTPKEMQKA